MSTPSYRASDRHLDEALAARVVAEQFPDLAGLAVDELDEGWDNEIYTVGDEWLFRFPKRADQLEWLDRETAILRIVADATSLTVPRFERFGRPSGVFPYPFVGYRRVPGVGADSVELSEPAALAAELGRALTAIHAIDPALIPPTPSDWENEPADGQLTELVEDAEWVRPYLSGEVAELAEPYLRGEVPRPPFSGPRRFIHNDICPDHVLVDPDGRRLTGIIDFADAMVGDPVGDLVGLVCLRGYGFVYEVLQHYDHPLDDTFDDRLHWASRVLHLHGLVEADDIDDDAEIAKHTAWVVRAFDSGRAGGSGE